MEKDQRQNYEFLINKDKLASDCGNIAGSTALELQEKINCALLPSSINTESSCFTTSFAYSSTTTPTTTLSCEYEEYCPPNETFDLHTNILNNKRITDEIQRYPNEQNFGSSGSNIEYFSYNSNICDRLVSNVESDRNSQEIFLEPHISATENLPLKESSTLFSTDFQYFGSNDVSEGYSFRREYVPSTSLLPQYSTPDESHIHMPHIPLAPTNPSSHLKEINSTSLASTLTGYSNKEDTTSFNFPNCFLNRPETASKNTLYLQVPQNEEYNQTEARPENLSNSQEKGDPSIHSDISTFFSDGGSEKEPLLHKEAARCILSPPSGKDGVGNHQILSHLKERNLRNLLFHSDLKDTEEKCTPVASSSNEEENWKESILYSSHPQYSKVPLLTSSGRCTNWFNIVHRDNFGVSPPRFESLSDISSKVRKTYSLDSCEDEDDSLWSDTASSCSSTDTIGNKNGLDTSNWSIEETLHAIRKPNLIEFEEPKPENLHAFLTPHDVGHINYLVRCYSDAMFSISIPSSFLEDGRILSPVTYLNLHMLGVFQVYYLMFKCEDFRNLTSHDQVSLLDANMIPILISIGFIFFNTDKKSWTIPFVISNTFSTLPLCSLFRIIPEKTIHNLTILHEVIKDLEIDETISLLFAFIIMYTPLVKPVKDLDVIDKVRDKYVNILFQYLRWKFGPQNGAMLFPEILKILDALLKFGEEINDYKFQLNDDELKILKYHFEFIERQMGSCFLSQNNSEKGDADFPQKEISYSSFHTKLSSIFLRLSTG